MPRRLDILAIAPLVLALAGCNGPSTTVATPAPGPSQPPADVADKASAPQDEDYAKARAAYTTKVTWNGHAPVGARPTKQMEGADPLPYGSDGLSLLGFVTPDPGDGQKHPAVVFLGEGFNLDGNAWRLARTFRDAGFVAMAPMPRAENQQKGVFTLFYRETDDVLAATEALAKLPYVDGARIFVAGVREGGTQALLCAMASDRYEGVAAIDPVLDIAAFTAQNRYLVAFDRKDIREYQLRSPLAYATSLKCPARVYIPEGNAAAEKAAREFQKRAEARSIPAKAEAVPIPTAPPRDPAAPGKKGGPPRPPTINAEAVRRSIAFFQDRK